MYKNKPTAAKEQGVRIWNGWLCFGTPVVAKGELLCVFGWICRDSSYKNPPEPQK